ncbi:MAG: type II toxin-antitoxin system RelE family toxin [Candidatus Binatia bacterium]
MKTGFRDSFAKDLRAVKERNPLNRVREVIEVIEKADSLVGLPNLKKLKGGRNYFRMRVGEYRIGIALEKDTVLFVRFLHRKDIYKYFP